MKKIFKNLPESINGRKLKEKYLIEILWLIASGPALNEDYVTPKGYTILSSKMLNKHIPSYKGYIRLLEKAGLIECDGLYIGSNISDPFRKPKAYGYRINPDRIHEVEELFFDFNSEILFHKELTLIQKESYLYDFLIWRLQRSLSLDKAAALTYELDYYQKTVPDIDKWPISKSKKHPINPIYQYKRNLQVIERFSYLKNSYSISESTGRFHSVLTHMNSRIRPFLRHNDQPLVSLDVSSANIYFLCLLFNPDFWRNARGSFGLNNLKNSRYFLKYQDPILHYLDSIGFSCFESGISSLMLDKNPKEDYRPKFEKLQHELSSGTFYTSFYSKYISSDGNDNIAYDGIFDLDECKIGILKFINASHLFRSAVQRAFKNEYPFIGEVLTLLKKIDEAEQHDHGAKRHSISNVPCLLMTIESTLMLFRIAKRIHRQFPDCPIYTIHDCILTTAEWKDKVFELMTDILENCVGIKPHIKVQNLKPVAIQSKENKIERILPKSTKIEKVIEPSQPDYHKSTDSSTAKVALNEEKGRFDLVPDKRIRRTL